MKKLVGILIVATFVLLGAYVKSSRSSAAPAGPAPSEIAENKSDDRREVVVKHVISFEAAPEARQAPPAEPAHDDSMPPEQVAQSLEDAFHADPPGETGNRMADSITTSFRGPAARGATLRGVECHATRCRMEVQFDDDASDRRVVSGIFDLLSSSGIDTHGLGFIIPTRTTDADGKVEATVHLFHQADGVPGPA